MSDQVSADITADGHRLRLKGGAVEVTLGLDGSPGALEAGLRAVIERFRTLVDELAVDADLIDQVADPKATTLASAASRRMWRAVRPFAAATAMAPRAAFDGAIAEEILAAALVAARFDRLFAICGADTALYLTPGFGFQATATDGGADPLLIASLDVRSADPVRGIASRGRRFGTDGGADSVTLLAQTAAKAGAAATLIARAVPLDGSDREAVAAGLAIADRLVADGLVGAAVIQRGDEIQGTGPLPFLIGDAAAAAPRAQTRRRAGR